MFGRSLLQKMPKPGKGPKCPPVIMPAPSTKCYLNYYSDSKCTNAKMTVTVPVGAPTAGCFETPEPMFPWGSISWSLFNDEYGIGPIGFVFTDDKCSKGTTLFKYYGEVCQQASAEDDKVFVKPMCDF